MWDHKLSKVQVCPFYGSEAGEYSRNCRKKWITGYKQFHETSMTFFPQKRLDLGSWQMGAQPVPWTFTTLKTGHGDKGSSYQPFVVSQHSHVFKGWHVQANRNKCLFNDGRPWTKRRWPFVLRDRNQPSCSTIIWDDLKLTIPFVKYNMDYFENKIQVLWNHNQQNKKY